MSKMEKVYLYRASICFDKNVRATTAELSCLGDVARSFQLPESGKLIDRPSLGKAIFSRLPILHSRFYHTCPWTTRPSSFIAVNLEMSGRGDIMESERLALVPGRISIFLVWWCAHMAVRLGCESGKLDVGCVERHSTPRQRACAKCLSVFMVAECLILCES
jgi:hypothetical protein